jgi:hypothetical protein
MQTPNVLEVTVGDNCIDLSIIMSVYNAVNTVSRSINSFLDLT